MSGLSPLIPSQSSSLNNNIGERGHLASIQRGQSHISSGKNNSSSFRVGSVGRTDEDVFVAVAGGVALKSWITNLMIRCLFCRSKGGGGGILISVCLRFILVFVMSEKVRR